MSKTNWKGFERDIARSLGVERYSKSHLGMSVPDVIKKLKSKLRLIIECKNKKHIVIEKEMKSAKKHLKSEKDLSILCFRKTGSPKTNVFISLRDFRKIFATVDKKNYLQMQDITLSLKWKDFLKIISLAEASFEAKRVDTKRD